MIVPTADGSPWAAPVTAEGTGAHLNAFHIVALTFLRARQLQAGARPRVESASRRPTRVALFEVLSDAVSWSLSEPPPPVGDQPRTDATPPPPDHPRHATAARKSLVLGL
jgi:DNA-directed RNA polymerase subunit K/omega